MNDFEDWPGPTTDSVVYFSESPSLEPHFSSIELIRRRSTADDGYALRVIQKGGYGGTQRREIAVSAAEGGEILRILEKLRLPALPDWIMGLDGTTYLCTITNGLNSVTYCWWSDLPKPWAVLGALKLRLESLVP